LKKLVIILISIMILGFVFRCEKYEPLNIILYDKSPEVIKKYIEEKWKLIYNSGGWVGKYYYDTMNYNFEFTSDNRYLFWIGNGPIKDEQPITWSRGPVSHGSQDSIWFMYIGATPYFVDKIYYDTLIYTLRVMDGETSHLVRTKQSYN
jgi:hypothetical protein